MALAIALPPASSSMDVEVMVDDPHGIIDDPSQTIPEFCYQPLDSKHSGIRLLVLQPLQEGAGDLVRCELRHVTFGEKPVFKALSYTWGTSEETKTIFMNNQRFEIRENLYDALVHLRQEIEGQALWVDAICINQRDDEERCSQVSFMDHIYSRAICVLIWLGGYPQSLPEPLENVRCLLQQFDTAFWIFDHPYWTRLWVIQEIGLARNLKLCIQNRIWEWELFNETRKYFDWHFKRQYRIENISNKRRDRHGYSNQLEILLESFQDAECQNPRDKIFGFLGLAHDCQDGSIQVDYGKPLFDLYAEVIFFFCRRKLFANGATNDLDRSMRLV
jgi:hypothetical protein